MGRAIPEWLPSSGHGRSGEYCRNPRQGTSHPWRFKPSPRAKTPRDQLVSSNTADPSLKNRCLRVLHKLSRLQGILPKSHYYPDGVTLSETIPYASGEFAEIWKGQRGEVQVCVKAFRPPNLDKIKRVCGDSDEGGFILMAARGSTVR